MGSVKRIFDVDWWEEIYDSLSRNRSRTLLTAFSIFWGIFILFMLMGSSGVVVKMLAENEGGESVATNMGTMWSERTSLPYKGNPSDREWNITIDDVAELKRLVPEIEIASPTIQQGATAEVESRSARIYIYGEFPEQQRVFNSVIIHGRTINDMDVAQKRHVCVITQSVGMQLFPGIDNPCGQYLYIDNVRYRVVGIFMDNNEFGDGVRLPYTTMQHIYNTGDRIDVLWLLSKPGCSMSYVLDEAAKHLKKRHNIHPDDTKAVLKVDDSAFFVVFVLLLKGLNLLTWMIGLGILIAGTIGVSNIMIVTVKERTVEIGIRRAIGATPMDIVTMIMTECIVLTLIAGMTGMTVAVGVLEMLESVLHADGIITPSNHFTVSFGLAVGALMILCILGVLAGLAPALRAMNIKPVDAMREE